MSEFEPMKVRWLDAKADSSFRTPAGCKTLVPAEICSIGWVFELEDRVIIAQDYYPNGSTQAEGYTYSFVVPRACILEIARLEVKGEKATD